MTETPEGYSLDTLPPDGTLLVTGWAVDVGASRFTSHGHIVTGEPSRIVMAARIIGERLRDRAPMEVTLVVPIQELDRLITRLTEARNVGMPLAEIEGDLDGP